MRLRLYLAAIILASHAAITPTTYAQQAPVQTVIPFNPPLGQALYMDRTITRETRAEPVVKTTRHRLVFTKLGRGYTLEMRLMDIKVTGPKEIAELLAFGDRLISDETLVFTIGETGEILNVEDVAGSYERMRTAITDMQAQVGASDSSPMGKVMQGSFLANMANMNQDAHRQFLIGSAQPLLQFAGREVRANSVIARDGTSHSYLAVPEKPHMHFVFKDEDGNLSDFTVSSETGLTRQYSRTMVINFGGLTRITQDDATVIFADEAIQ